MILMPSPQKTPQNRFERVSDTLNAIYFTPLSKTRQKRAESVLTRISRTGKKCKASEWLPVPVVS